MTALFAVAVFVPWLIVYLFQRIAICALFVVPIIVIVGDYVIETDETS